MTPIEGKVKTLELLKEWSTWLVAVDTGALVAVGAFTDVQSRCSQYLLAAGTLLLLLSLLCATVLVGAVPVIAERLLNPSIPGRVANQMRQEDSIYGCRYGGVLPIRVYATAQHLFFGVAAILLALAIIVELGVGIPVCWGPM